MKATVPEIAWHNKNPVFTIDIQREISNGFYRAATGGGDSHIVIWHLYLKEEENETVVSVDFAADLHRHIKAVNVVRFSNDSKFLASGDDDAVIIIWTLKEDLNNSNNCFSNEENNKENWSSIKVLRGHKDDIYDLCWSPVVNELISGSVDNTAILWNVNKGQHISKIGEHNGFVQGVAWDPKGKYWATLCSDRALRLFDIETRKMVAKVTKAKITKNTGNDDIDDENLMKLFHDDTVKTFFRRLCFSPDGNLIFAPCGIYNDNESEAKPPKDVTYIFLKNKPERPIFHLPSRDEYTVAVKCCPILFELNPTKSNLFLLPYRIVFAIASRQSVVFYDTQQLQPIAIVSDIHYATLTDISWSPDGRLLLASSSDGYCTIITFKQNELGVPYAVTPSKTKQLDDTLEDLGVEPLDNSMTQNLNSSDVTEDKKPENTEKVESPVDTNEKSDSIEIIEKNEETDSIEIIETNGKVDSIETKETTDEKMDVDVPDSENEKLERKT